MISEKVKQFLFLAGVIVLIVAATIAMIAVSKLNSVNSSCCKKECPLGDYLIIPKDPKLLPDIDAGYSTAKVKMGNVEYTVCYTGWSTIIPEDVKKAQAWRRVRIFTATNDYITEYDEYHNLKIFPKDWEMQGSHYLEIIYIVLDSHGNELDRFTKD